MKRSILAVVLVSSLALIATVYVPLSVPVHALFPVVEEESVIEWEIPSGGTFEVITNAGTAADYEIHNDGQSSVSVQIYDHASGEPVGNPVTIHKDETKHVGVSPGQDMKINDAQPNDNHGASGTYQRL